MVRTFGKYGLVEPLASGGMADVWRAEVTGAEGVVKEVALKLVRGEHAARGDFVRMFVQEARLAARLTHANVVQVFEFDQVDGRYYIAMELVRGRHLGLVAERARELGLRFGLARAAHVGAEIAKALAYAHRLSEGGRPLGLVHRDVSPHNVLVSFEGEVKLADFGIARAVNAGELTDPGTLKGKLAYMAPEQARGGAVDGRADVFSLGVILWELCTGRRLHARDSDAATLAAVLEPGPASPPSAWNEEVTPELDAAILGALERDPERRTRSAQELATALAGVLLRIARDPEDVDLRAFMHRLFPVEAAAAGPGSPPALEPTRVRPAPLAREPAEGGAPGPGEVEESRTRTAPAAARRRPRPRTLAAGAAVAALAAAALAILATGVDGARPGPAPAPAEAEAAPPTSAPGEPTAPGGSPPGIAGASEGSERSEGPATSAGAPAAVAAAAEQAGSGERRSPPTSAPPGGAPRPWEAVHALYRLETPPAASGEGILSVNASPWGEVLVDGVLLGETPQEIRLPAGRHHVRIERPNLAPVSAAVTVESGRRTRFLH